MRSLQVVADKSFGLKNKKKSKAVQQYVATLNNSVGKGSQAEAKKRADKAAKEAKLQAKAEFESLYKTVENKKDKERMEREAALAAMTPEQKWQEKFDKLSNEQKVAELLSGTDPVVLARTLEDRVEECRRWVEKKTPITATIFRDWLARRKADKVAKQEKEKAERLMKGRLTGRELWPTIVGTVQDDEGAADDSEMGQRVDPEVAAREAEELRRQDAMIAKLREQQKKGNTAEEEEYAEAMARMAEEQGVSLDSVKPTHEQTGAGAGGEDGDDLDSDLEAELAGLEDEDLEGLEEAMLESDLG